MEMICEVAGRQLRLRYTFNSICAVEDMAGVGMDRLMDKAYSAVRLLFWGALIDRQPEMTIKEAGEIIGQHIKGGGRLDDIAGMCAEALERAGFAMPEMG